MPAVTTEEAPAPSPGRRTAIAAVVVGILVLGGAFALWELHSGPEPTRLFVAVEGCGERCDGAIRAELVRRFAELGFEALPDPAEAPPDTDGLDEAVSAASAIGAAHVVHVGLEVRTERDGLRPGSRFVVVAATAEVREIGGGGEPPPSRTYVFGAEGEDRDDAVARTTRAFATVIDSETAGDLFAMPALVTSLEDPDSFSDLETKSRFDRALERRSGQARTRERYEEECAITAGEIVEDGLVHCAMDACSESYLYGIDPTGRQAFVHVDTPTVYIPFDASPAPRSGESVERLELQPLGGGQPRVLAEAANFYGYGSLSEDGRVAAFVEQGDARFGVVTLDVRSGARRVLDLAERPASVQQARVSPDGRWVAYFFKPFARGAAEVRLVSSEGAAEHRVVTRRARTLRWVVVPLEHGGAPRLAVATVGSESVRGEAGPLLYDPEGDAAVAVDVGDREVQYVIGAHEGTLYFVASPPDERRHCELGVRDRETLATRFLPLVACVDDAHMTPNGRIVGVAVVTRDGDPNDRDTELVVVDPATGEIDQRTSNAAGERYPRVSADGRRVAFERHAHSRFRGINPNAICWTDL